jgi:hypothetical protein
MINVFAVEEKEDKVLEQAYLWLDIIVALLLWFWV